MNPFRLSLSMAPTTLPDDAAALLAGAEVVKALARLNRIPDEPDFYAAREPLLTAAINQAVRSLITS